MAENALAVAGRDRNSVALPAWILGRDPTRKIICASYGDQLSKDFSNRFRDLLWSPQYQAIFLGMQIDAGGASLAEVRTNARRRVSPVPGLALPPNPERLSSQP